jgi:hypothetical protein
MTSNIDIYQTANELIKQHGGDCMMPSSISLPSKVWVRLRMVSRLLLWSMKKVCI